MHYYPFDLRQLISFAEIARCNSYRKAAVSLRIAQPALTRHIQNLEAAIGVRLFNRTNRRVALTPAGKALLARLPPTFAALDQIALTSLRSAEGQGAVIRIGEAGNVTANVLAPALRMLRKRYPKLQIEIYHSTSQGYLDDLVEGKIDCAFPLLQTQRPDLAFERLSTHEVGIVLPAEHRLARFQEIPLRDLRNERWILFPRKANSSMYDELLAGCRKAGFSPQVVDEITSRPRAISMVACGIGVTTLADVLRHFCIRGTLYRRLIRPTPTVTSFIAYRRADQHPILKELVRNCKKLAG
jgi:DNA-binding transcriptional LysR family regulator